MTTTPPDHLLPEFDPQRALAAHLRGILIQHDIPFPTNAKKGDLVSLFETQIRPQAPRLLKRIRQIKASDSGIIDGEGRDGASLAELDTSSDSGQSTDRKISSIAARKKAASKKKTTRKTRAKELSAVLDVSDATNKDRASTIEAESRSVVTKARKRKAIGFVTSTPKALNDDASSSEDDASARKSACNERIKSHATRRRSSPKYESGGEAGFSDFNPFQSGTEYTPPRKRRRKSSLGPQRMRSLADDLTERTAESRSAGRKSMSSLPSAYKPIASDEERIMVSTSRNTLDRPGTPSISLGTRFMAPLKQVKSVPPQAQVMKSQLARYDRERDHGGELSNETDDVPYAAFQRDGRDTRHDRDRASTLSSKAEVSRRRLGVADTRGSQLPCAVHQSRLHRRSKSLLGCSLGLSTMLRMALAVILVGYGFWWREEKLMAGYCDTDADSNSMVNLRSGSLFLNAHLPTSIRARSWPREGKAWSWLDRAHLRPSCATCPAHGSCSDGEFLGCDQDYVVSHSPFRLGGALPLAPNCIPDSEKLLLVAIQASRLAKVLRVHRGEVICRGIDGTRSRQHKHAAWIYGMESNQLFDLAKFENRKSALPLTDFAVDELCQIALRDLQNHGEVFSYEHNDELWYAAVTAEQPLGCRIRRTLAYYAEQHKLPLTLLWLLIVLIVFVRYRLRSRSRESAQVRALVQAVMVALKRQSKLHYLDSVIASEPGVAQSHLRDLILRNYHSAARRHRLWAKVSRVVEENANVRAKEIDVLGEEMPAWVWAGKAQGLLEDSSSDQEMKGDLH